ncbi:hypothetical protein IMSAGC015_02150 [Lachnospiraceae bacterium]|nr:hypothetical protein IMSAGC015_02150 [Lachnospiraceae bacterium]
MTPTDSAVTRAIMPPVERLPRMLERPPKPEAVWAIPPAVEVLT